MMGSFKPRRRVPKGALAMSKIKSDPAGSVPDLDLVSLSPVMAAKRSGVSVATIYRLLAAQAFTARRMGARTLIDGKSWRAYFTGLPEYIPGASMPNAPHVTGRHRALGRGKRKTVRR